jgi:hypothetical protein
MGHRDSKSRYPSSRHLSAGRSTRSRRCAHVEPMSHGPAHHDGGSLAGKDSLFDSSTGSRTGSGSAGLLIGRPTASSSLIATVGRGRGARSGFMSHTMARRCAWRPALCATRRVAALTRARLAAVDPCDRAGGAPPAGASQSNRLRAPGMRLVPAPTPHRTAAGYGRRRWELGQPDGHGIAFRWEETGGPPRSVGWARRCRRSLGAQPT